MSSINTFEGYYRDESGVVSYHHNGSFLGSSNVAPKEIAFAFNSHSCVLYKHGDADLVIAWVADAKRLLTDAGNDDSAARITIISAPSSGDGAWDPKLINRFVSSKCHIGVWYNKTKEDAYAALSGLGCEAKNSATESKEDLLGKAAFWA